MKKIVVFLIFLVLGSSNAYGNQKDVQEQHAVTACSQNNHDQKSRLNCLKKLSDNKNYQARFLLGMAYQEGMGVPKDASTAYKLMKSAALQNNQQAEINLAESYRTGKITPIDHEKSYYWYKKLASQNNPSGEFMLAMLYAEGIGVKKSNQKAFYWLT